MLREIYGQEIAKVWGDGTKMYHYCMKKADVLVPLDNGEIYEIEKPTIETSFCFGHGYCGITSPEDEQRAYACERIARTNEDYFLEENLRDINAWIEALQDKKVYKYGRYYGKTEGKLRNITVLSYWQTPSEGMEEISDSERQALIAGYEEEKKRFTKRLKTYLKRYGLSKLKTWTYLVD